MLGNDVVDLGDPETRTHALHPRFDARVFTPHERTLLASAAQPARLRWKLWALKEAAYKCLKKLSPDTRFSPQRFAVEPAGGRAFGVRIGEKRLRAALWEAGDSLHAIATDGADPERCVQRALRALTSDAAPALASDAVRALARDAAAAHLGCAPAELRFAHVGRAPRLLRGDSALALDVSLSHHGRFVAAALEIAPGGAPA